MAVACQSAHLRSPAAWKDWGAAKGRELFFSLDLYQVGEKFSVKEIVKMTWWTDHHAIRGKKNLLSQRSYEDFFFSSADRKRTLRVLYRYEMPGIGGVEKGFIGFLGVQCYDQAFGQE